MPLLDVSRVTSTLVRLLDTHINDSPAWPSAVTLTVSPDPPDRLAGEATLGVYLYHLAEDPHRKNLPPPAGNGGAVRLVPMGLNLHYQVTPHSDLEDGIGALREQLMLGCAVKALHDFPLVDDTTAIAGTSILDPALAGADNRLRIVLQPIPFGEASSYWTAGTHPLRLAAYYEISVVLLEADEPRSRAGRVLQYGVFVGPAESPRLDGSRSTIAFTLPGETAARELEARPAQVAPGGTLVLEGSALTGDETTLLLRSARWDQPVAADAAWALAATPTRVTAVAQATASGEDVVPGVYSALIRVRRRRTVADGLVRDFEQPSNATPFVVVPRLTAVSPPQQSGLITITGATFQHADIAPEDVDVYVGETRLTRDAPPPPDPPAGAFRIESPTSIRLRLPSGLAAGSTHPLRVIVNGAESAPRWVVAP